MMRSTVERIRGSSGGMNPTSGSNRFAASRAVSSYAWVKAPSVVLYPRSRTWARICSRIKHHRGRSASRCSCWAARMPRSSATQHMTLEYKKWRGPPRISQIPLSGSCQCEHTYSTRVRINSHIGPSSSSPQRSKPPWRRKKWIQSSTSPNMSSCF